MARGVDSHAAVAPLSTAASEFQAARRALKDRIKDEIEAAGVMTQEVVTWRLDAAPIERANGWWELLARERARAAGAEVHTLEMEVSEVSKALRGSMLKEESYNRLRSHRAG